MAMHEFQLGLLPERNMDWRTLATSYGLEIILILLLLNLSLLLPQRLNLNQQYHITELIPLPALRPEAYTPPKTPAVHKLLPAPPVTTTPKLSVPPEVRVPRQRPEVEPPKVVVNNFTPAVLKPALGGARAMLAVHTGDFSGSSVTPTVNVPVAKVQTGGFGDPNGLPGQGKPNAKLVAAKTGSFDLPPGPGYGNGSGGAKGIAGTVASAGFGNGIAAPGNGDGRSNGRGVQTAGFSAQEVAPTGMVKPKPLDNGPPTTPVEITFKPRPAYTQEARDMKLEGEVLLDVMFGANGQLQVNRVVRGLGHGLDEAAVAAASKMRYKPALRNGQAIDSSAIVHVVFQLAY